MSDLHCPPAAPPCTGDARQEDRPVTVPVWWCTSCEHAEASDVDGTQLCSDCRSMQDGQHRRLAVGAGGASPVREGLDRGLEQVEVAQRLLVDTQLETERLIDAADPALSMRLASSVDRLLGIGAALLSAHSAMSLARLAAGHWGVHLLAVGGIEPCDAVTAPIEAACRADCERALVWWCPPCGRWESCDDRCGAGGMVSEITGRCR
jgi:hypothetical protein